MMLPKYILLMFLPAVVYSTITIKIEAGTDIDNAYVSYKGDDRAIISDQERKVFNITNEDLKKITEGIYGVACTDTFVKSPTSHGDVYSIYGWDPVVRHVEPIESRVVSIDTSPVLLASTNYSNDDSNPIMFDQNLIKVVEETIQHTWRDNPNLTLEKGVNYDVNFGAGSVGGMLSLRYISRFGENGQQERKVTIGDTVRSAFTVEPNSTVVEYLYAVKGKMVVEMQYRAILNGHIFCNFENKYKGQHYYALDVNTLIDSAKLPRELYSYENITVNFYIQASFLLADAETDVPLKNVSGGIIPA